MALLMWSLLIAPPADYPAERVKAWEPEIALIEAKLKTTPPKPGAVFFAGSSSFRLWDTAKAFPDHDTVNVAFGGSELRDTVHFYDRILKPHAPGRIVLYAGDNDIAAGRTPDQVTDDFRAFVKLVHASDAKTKIDYVAIKPSPSRDKQRPKQDEANAAVRKLTLADDRLTFHDIVPELLNADGKPDPKFFKLDRLHLNDAGYAAWKTTLLKAWAK